MIRPLNQLLYAQHSTANGEHHAKVNLELHIFASSLKVFQICHQLKAI